MLRSHFGHLSGGRRESGKTIHRAQAPSVGLITSQGKSPTRYATQSSAKPYPLESDLASNGECFLLSIHDDYRLPVSRLGAKRIRNGVASIETAIRTLANTDNSGVINPPACAVANRTKPNSPNCDSASAIRRASL